MKLGTSVKCFAALSIICACATPTRYHWGGYESALYAYSRNPELREQYEKSLREAISEGEETNRVAPGLYAELGYLSLEAGDDRAAMEAFAREMELFPESRKFLTSISNRTRGGV